MLCSGKSCILFGTGSHCSIDFQLERALRLIQRGDIDIGNQINARDKAAVKLPFKYKVTGKETTGLLFSEQNWGSCTREYSASVNKRDIATLEEIVSMARAIKTSTLDGVSSEDGSSQDNAMLNDQMAAASQRKNICRSYIISLSWLLMCLNRIRV